MLRILQKIMQQGNATEDYFMSAVQARFRGQMELSDQRCRDCRKCGRNRHAVARTDRA